MTSDRTHSQAIPVSRTRTGCRTCRSRKIKCDERRPKCQRCTKSNLDCSYGLQLIWHEESLSKGVCHGRAGVWSKSGRRKDETHLRSRESDRRCVSATTGSTKSRGVFLNTTMNDVKLYFEYGGMAEEDGQNENQASMPNEGHQHPGNLSLSLPVLSTTTLGHLRTFDYDSALLSYYEAVVCSSSTLLDDAKNNPYRHLILPMAMQSEGLYHATLAVSAQILRIADPRFRFAALDHGHRALRCLIASLQRGQSTPKYTNHKQMSNVEIDEILGLALMLCWFEITDGCRPSWVTHLKGIHTLINQYQDIFIKNSRTSDVSRFFSRYFSFHLVLARTTFRVEDDITFTKTTSSKNTGNTEKTDAIMQYYPSISKLTDFLSLAMPLEDLDQIDSYMGFSNSLLLLINEVADLAWKYHSKESVETDLPFVREQVWRLRASLETLQQTPPPLPIMVESMGRLSILLRQEKTSSLSGLWPSFRLLQKRIELGHCFCYMRCALRGFRDRIFLESPCQQKPNQQMATIRHQQTTKLVTYAKS
uniref:Arginine metabolism regulation protein II n=1 Tax=Talaromyces marneffei PM1 TaxID=1077442 RepID=A0A093VF23_TALMA